MVGVSVRDLIRTLACITAHAVIGLSVALFGWLAVNLAYAFTH